MPVSPSGLSVSLSHLLEICFPSVGKDRRRRVFIDLELASIDSTFLVVRAYDQIRLLIFCGAGLILA